jgi:hypothetical protein
MKAIWMLALAACGTSGSDGTGLTGTDPADAGPPDAPHYSSATVYRLSSLGLSDPHLYFGLGTICLDVTPFVNNVATNFLDVDASEPADGKLDGSLAIAFRPLVTTGGSSTAIDIEVPVCSAPALTSVCTATASTPKYATTVTSQATGTCLDVLPDTASDPPTLPAAPCFASAATTITVNFLGADITLVDARGAASYDGDNLRSGLIRGFLSKEDAQALQFKIPNYGTHSIASFLYGGGSCHDDTDHPMGDMDVGPNGKMGWYIYLQFEAIKVPYLEQ